MLEAVVLLKALVEIAGFALLGQGMVFVFVRIAGGDPARNIPYAILKVVTSPVFWLARAIAPRFMPENFIWMLTPALVILAWILVTYLKIRLVLTGG